MQKYTGLKDSVCSVILVSEQEETGITKIPVKIIMDVLISLFVANLAEALPIAIKPSACLRIRDFYHPGCVGKR